VNPESQSTLGRRETGLIAEPGQPSRTCGEEQPGPTTKPEPRPALPPGFAAVAVAASPLPWRLVEEVVGEVRIVDADGCTLMLATSDEESWETDVANVRMIVAAVNANHQVHASGNGVAHYSPLPWRISPPPLAIRLRPAEEAEMQRGGA